MFQTTNCIMWAIYEKQDQLGRPELLTNASQAVVWKANLKAFDRTVQTSSISSFNLGLTSGILPYALRAIASYVQQCSRHCCPGQCLALNLVLVDKESGLYYNMFRYYDPQLGRYIQSDPIGLAGGINTYAYALNNPLMHTDPLGLTVKLCSRELGGTGELSPNQFSPIRHDYLVINDKSQGFTASGNFVMSDGKIIDTDDANNSKCETIHAGNDKDQAVLDAIDKVGTPTYSVFARTHTGAYMMGARNCQSWAQDVLKIAK
jgi:RHS repeat-associated protein